MKKIILIFLAAALFAAGAAAADSARGDVRTGKRILVLVSFHMSHLWTEQLVNTIRSDCAELPDRPDLTITSFDMMRTHFPKEWQDKFSHYLTLAAAGKYDLILTVDDPINRLLMKNAEKIPADLPVVFCGYEYPPANLKSLHPNLTGIIQPEDPCGTLRLGLALYPKTKSVLVLSDDSPVSRSFEEHFRKELPALPGVRIDFMNNSRIPINELLEKIENLPKDSLLILSPWRGLHGNDYQTLDAFGADLSRFAKQPYLVNSVGLFGYHALGGYVVDPVVHGHETVRLLRKVLQTGSAKNIPFVRGSIAPVFDWKVLQANHLDPAVLPEETVLLNRPPSFWEQHGRIVLICACICLMIVLVSFLYVFAARRNLRRGRDLIRIMPGQIGAVGTDEKILFFSPGGTETGKISEVRTLRDVPDSNYEKLSAAVREVFRSGKNSMLEINEGPLRRAVFISPVPRHFFGQEAVIWYSHDNADLQEARIRAQEYAARLKSSTRMWDLLINTLPLHVFAKDPDNGFRYVFGNAAMERFCGIPAAGFAGKHDYEIFPGLSRAGVEETNRKAMENGGLPLEHTDMLRDKDGKEHYFRSIKQAFADGEGKRLLLGMSVDITESETLKNDLQDSVSTFNILMDSMPCHVLAKDIGNGLRFVFANRSFCRLIGTTNSGLIGRCDSDFYADRDTLAQIAAWDEEAIRLNAPTEHLLSYPDSSGVLHTSHTHWLPLTLSGNRRWLFLVMDDVTEYEKEKRKAQENAEWLRLTLNSIGDGVIATDREGRVTMMNPVAERMLGWSAAETIGQPHDRFFRISSSDSDLPTPSPVLRTLRTGTIVELANHTDLLARDGRRFHVSDSSAPIFGTDRQILGAILVFRDVTEEYLQRDRLRLAFAQLEAGTRVTRSATFIYNSKTDEISGSALLKELVPIRDGHVAEVSSWIFADDQAEVYRKWQNLKNRASESETFDFRARKEDGLHYFRMYVNCEADSLKQWILTGVIQDVTVLRRAFEKLEEQKNLWEMVINAIPICFFAKDAKDFRYVLSNTAFAEKLLGRRVEDVIGKTDSELFNRPEDADWFRDWDLKIMNSRDGEEFEETATDYLGRIRVFQTVKKPFHCADGRRLLIGASADITELRHLVTCEKANSEVLNAVAQCHDFETAVDSLSGVMMRRMDCDRIMLVQCDEKGILGLRKEWLSPGTASIREVGLERHVELWNKNSHLLRANRIIRMADVTNDKVVSTGLRRDDKYRTISLIVAPVFLDGALWGAFFVSYARSRREFDDVDERIMRTCANAIAIAADSERQRQALRQADRERQLVLDNIHIPIWLHDRTGALVRANTAVCDLFGIPRGSLTTEKNRELLTAAFPAGTIQPIEETISTGKTVRRAMNLPGKEYIVTADPLFDDSGKLAFLVESAIDMTEFNRLLGGQKVVNCCLETLLSGQDVMKALERALEAICTHFGASRSYLLSFDLKKRTVSSFLEYTAPGEPFKTPSVRDQPFTAKPAWVDRFRKDNMIVIEDTAKVSESDFGPAWLETVRKGGCRSIYAARLMIRSEIWGYLGLVFRHSPVVLDKDLRNFLLSFAHFIEVILERMDASARLQETLEITRRSEQKKAELLENVQTVNSCLEALFTEENEEKAIRTVLKTISGHFKASRGYLLQITPDKKFQKIFFEYSPEGTVIFEPGKSFALNADDPWYRQMLSSDSIMKFRELSSPESEKNAGNWLGFARKQDIRSAYLARIMLDGALWGVLGIIYEHGKSPDFTDSDLELLNSAAHLIEVMLQRRESEHQIVEAMKKAQAADRAKSFFIASVSHEIRTPLNAVIGFAELLREGNVPPAEMKEDLESIAFSGNALLQLVNDVLDLSKLEAGQMEILPEPADFAKLGSEVMRVFAQRAAERKVRLIIDIPDLPMLALDKLRIRQILFNLIGNAVKFTPSGSITLRARFTPAADAASGELLFSVTDTGIGISPADQNRLMEPFVQLSRVRSGNAAENGTGLGLSISKRLVEKMGGFLGIESRVGKGSTFFVRLPKIAVAGEKPRDAVLPAAPQPPMPRKQLSVLLVDDVPMNLKVMAAMCRKAGAEDLVTAENGSSALDELRKRRYDIVFTDMWMPGMNGAELAAKIRADARLKEIPLVAVTADMEARDNFPLGSFNGVLLKPITLEKMRDALGLASASKGL